MGNTLQTTLPQIPPEQELQPQPQPQQPSPEQDDTTTNEFTCEICIEPISGNRFTNGNQCSHPFCTTCIIKYIRVQLEDNNVAVIKCPAVNCDRTLDARACASLVGEQLFVRWCDVLCEAAIGGLERCYCPYGNCSALIVDECGGGRVRKSMCPVCKRWFCFECKRVWHAGFGCEESGEQRDENDVAFGRLAEQRLWMRCPRCRHFVELREGCQIVKCRCGISFCYRCGKQVHQHWCRCNRTFLCWEWCFRSLIVLIFLIFMIFFFWASQKRHEKPT